MLRSLGWEMQVDFEHISEAELSSPGYLEAILAVMNLKAGVREDDEKRQAFRDVIHGVARKKDESLGQYATRRLRDFTKAETYGISLPAEFKVSLMKEGANLTDQNLQNLAVLTLGKENDVDFLATAMARLDVRGDRLSGYVHEEAEDRGRGNVYAEGVEREMEIEESDADSQDDESIPDEAVLAELEDLSFNEEQAALVFALIENRPPRRRRTWKENKLFKAEVRKERKPFRKGSSPPHGSGGRGNGRGDRPRVSREQLKKLSKCRLCGRRGHWAEDCDQSRPSSGENSNVSGFCYLGPSSSNSFVGVTMAELHKILSQVKNEEKDMIEQKGTFLALQSGAAILDIGATQDLIGEVALGALEQVLASKGLKPVEVPAPGGAPTGIGGAATVKKAVLVPISFGGVPGTVHFVVIGENVPPLLSVGLLEHLGATMCLTTNTVEFKKIGVKQAMRKETSGHRTIPLVEWGGGFFPVPDEARKKFGLARDAFMLKGKDSSAYAKQKGEGPSVPEVSCIGKVSGHSSEHCQVMHLEPADPRVLSSCSHIPSHDFRARSMHSYPADLGPMCQRINSTTSGSGLALHQHDGDGARHSGGARMASASEPDVLHDGGHTHDVCPAYLGGKRPEVLEVREKEVLGGGCPDPRTMPPRRKTHQQGQPVRQLAGLRELRGEDQLCSEGTIQGEGESSDHNIISGTSTSGTERQSASRKHVKCVRWDVGDRGGTASDGSGLPADEQHNGRVDAWPEPDDHNHDESARVTQLQPHVPGRDLRPGGESGDRDLLNEHRRGGDRRELVSSAGTPRGRRRDGEPQPAGRAHRWPTWMTTLMCASTLIQWGQCTQEMKEHLSVQGGGHHSWVVHCELRQKDKGETSRGPEPPQSLKHPWVYLTTVLGPDDVCVWHEHRGVDGEVLHRGPGSGPAGDPPEGHTLHRWATKNKLVSLLEIHDKNAGVFGMDSAGNQSSEGPYWHFSAELLGDFVAGNHESGEVLLKADDEEAVRRLGSLVRGRQRELSGSRVDLLEVFHAGEVSTMARQNGLKVLEDPSRFSDASGWTGLDKGHRKQVRHILQAERPCLVRMRLDRQNDMANQEDERALREGGVRAGLALEIAKTQKDHGLHYLLESNVQAEVWKQPEMAKILEDPETSTLTDPNGMRYLTNDVLLARKIQKVFHKNDNGNKEIIEETTKPSRPQDEAFAETEAMARSSRPRLLPQGLPAATPKGSLEQATCRKTSRWTCGARKAHERHLGAVHPRWCPGHHASHADDAGAHEIHELLHDPSGGHGPSVVIGDIPQPSPHLPSRSAQRRQELDHIIWQIPWRRSLDRRRERPIPTASATRKMGSWEMPQDVPPTDRV